MKSHNISTGLIDLFHKHNLSDNRLRLDSGISLFLIFLILFIFFAALSAATVFSQEPVSRDTALAALAKGETILSELIDKDLPYVYVNDTLYLAYLAFERAEYAEMIANQSLSGEVIEKAREALAGLDYKGFNYANVVKHVYDIEKRKNRTYYLLDSIRALEIKISEYSSKIQIKDIAGILDKAKLAFEEERFDDSESLIAEADSILGERISDQTTLKALVYSGKSMVSKFWKTLILILVMIAVLVFISWKKIQYYKLRHKLKRYKIEKRILTELMKETQRQRYQEGKIPQYLYEIKIKRYKERLAKIKAELPVLAKAVRKKK